jgi:DNA-binding NarL/FixJ family response regulator
MKLGRLLLADCHPDMLEGIRSLLGPLFEAVVMVADEASLLQAVETFEPHLTVLDLSLPASGGGNIARRLRKRYPGLKFIVLSVHDELTVVEEILGAGASGFVLKRAAGTDLLPAISEVLRGGTYVSPAVGNE